MALEKEQETFRRKLPELLASDGKFAHVHGPELVDTFASYEDALRAGYRAFGLESPIPSKSSPGSSRR